MPNPLKTVISTLLLLGLSLMPAAARASDITLRIIPESRYASGYMKESNSQFISPPGTVLSGRYHSGDENGSTLYEYTTLRAVDLHGNTVPGNITVETLYWNSWFKESAGVWYSAPAGAVLLGREHQGDENGNTRYLVGRVLFNGNPTQVGEHLWSGAIKESSSTWYRTDGLRVLTGRAHSGDENGYTNYMSGIVSIRVPGPTLKVVAKLHPDDAGNSFPHDDFIRTEVFLDAVGKISSACLSARGEKECYPVSQLAVVPENNGYTLTVYAAKTHHAVYARAGTFNVPNGFDKASGSGQEVDITPLVTFRPY
jgi:hypothetical protein